MLTEARANAPRECCGLLAGRNAIITRVFPARNALASETAFEIAPQELFPIFRAIREAGLQHLGIYHSHPNGRLYPSARDIELAYYPDAAYFVLSPLADAQPFARAFRIHDGVVIELVTEILDD